MAQQQIAASIFDIKLRVRAAALVAFAMFTAMLTIVPAAPAQTFTVLNSFGDTSAGAHPYAGLTVGLSGSFYGSTTQGGSRNGGTVFQLRQKSGGWILSSLYSFRDGSDGGSPLARPIIGVDGALYGTTSTGGYFNEMECFIGCGVVYNLQPPSNVCGSLLCGWMETLPYTLNPDNGQGLDPLYGELLTDPSGNLIGTASAGGSGSAGTVYELTRSNGGWLASVIYSFQGSSDGAAPASGLVRDTAGNLYGTTQSGGTAGCGTVYKLSNNGSGWTKQVLHSFQCATDGAAPIGGLIFDQAGNLYGATPSGGTNGGGTVYELTPLGDNWTFTLLYTFSQVGSGRFAGSIGSLVMDAAGNLYGTTFTDGAYRLGATFELSPANGRWNYRSLHDFTLMNDGAFPAGNLVLDSRGNLYGTALDGGAGSCENGCGVIYEITP